MCGTDMHLLGNKTSIFSLSGGHKHSEFIRICVPLYHVDREVKSPQGRSGREEESKIAK